jgi:hypothetical protein
MAFFSSPRSRTVFLLAAGAFVLGAAVVALNAFNPRDIRQLTPQSSDEILVYSGLSILVFLLLVLLLVLLIRNLLKLFVDQRSRALGSRLRTRLVLGAALIALAPATFMFLYSFALMNRSVDRWFSQPTAELRSDSDRVVTELAHYAATNARLEAEAIAASPAIQGDEATVDAVVRSRSITLEGGYVAVYDTSHRCILGYQLPPETAQRNLLLWLTDGQPVASALHGPLCADILAVATRSDEPVLVVDGRDFVEGQAMTNGGRIIVVGLPLPEGLSETANRIRAGAIEYWTLFRSRNRIRATYFFMLLLITALVFFSSMWLALFLSKQITRPVEALADAMDEIADGKLDKRVAIESSGEMAELMRAFNHMAGDLQQSRGVAEHAREQLAAANLALESRRRELETIVETIPSGVVTWMPTARFCWPTGPLH